MATNEGEQRSKSRLVTKIRERIEIRTLVIVFVGVVAGYSLSVLGTDAVIVPFIGSVPGFLLGTAGLLVAVSVYTQVGCCENCNQTTFGFGSECGCAGDCDDSCSYDP